MAGTPTERMELMESEYISLYHPAKCTQKDTLPVWSPDLFRKTNEAKVLIARAGARMAFGSGGFLLVFLFHRGEQGDFQETQTHIATRTPGTANRIGPGACRRQVRGQAPRGGGRGGVQHGVSLAQMHLGGFYGGGGGDIFFEGFLRVSVGF